MTQQITKFGLLCFLGLISTFPSNLLVVYAHNQNLDKSKSSNVENLLNTGNTFLKKGQFNLAIEAFKKMLEISDQRQDSVGRIQSLIGLGSAYSDLGQYAKSLKVYNQALIIAKENQDRAGESAILNNIGLVYRNIVQFDKSLTSYNKALEIQKSLGDRRGISITLGNIGIIYRIKKEYSDALRYYQEALTLAQELNDREGEAIILNNVGFLYNQLGTTAKAFKSFSQSLAIYQSLKDFKNESVTRGNIGLVYFDLGQFESALNYYQEALAISRKIGDLTGEAKLSQYIGTTLKELKLDYLEVAFLKQSVNAYEKIRKDLSSLSIQEQKIYASSVSQVYRRLADLLLQQDRVVESLQVLDLLKVQDLDDYLRNIKGNDRTYQGIRLLEPEKAFLSQLLPEKYEKIPDLNQQLLNQIQQLPKSELNKAPDYLQNLAQGRVLLYPFILEDRLEVILFAANSPAIRRTSFIKKAKLKSLIADFNKELLNYKADNFLDTSKELYKLLIKPIEEDLQRLNTKIIFYAPDDILRYIPLTALHDGKQFLIEKYTINYLVAYILTPFGAKSSSQPSILAGAFGGRQGEKKFEEAGLPGTLVEISAISKLIQNTRLLSEDSFTRAATEAQLANHNILHLATHGSFNSGIPDDSFIIFGNGDKIRLSEMSDLKLSNIDLMVLSACQTAVGTKLGSGVEILGFGYQVQRAGAKSSIASLWRVGDEGTQNLMQAFYGYVKQTNNSRAIALRLAQIDMIRGQSFAHPYFWSPFILIGNGL
jgi:CHAT domain-containing protein/Tfp pilus assembly protein PilF